MYKGRVFLKKVFLSFLGPVKTLPLILPQQMPVFRIKNCQIHACCHQCDKCPWPGIASYLAGPLEVRNVCI